MAFHVNQKRLLKEEKENGVANVTYYEGQCMTCEHSPDRESRAACPRADFFAVTTYISRTAGVKTTTHLCKNWMLCSEITSCFKKNVSPETQTAPQNTFKGKSPKYK
jgi:hypothetical protein